MKRIHLPITILMITSTAVILTSCNGKTKAAEVVDEAIAVKVQPVTTTQYAPVLKYSGNMASTTEARLSFKIGGIISKIYVKEGDHVVKGQLLATLDLTEINAQVQQAAQGVEKVQRDVNRVKNLYNDTVATLEQVQNANTQLQVAEESLRIARFNQQYAQIRATENGTILKKLMNEGELASAGSPVFQFNGTAGNDWVIRFGVSDKDWAVLKKGEKATVEIDAYPNKTFTGIITEIAQGADVASGTYEIEVKVLPGNSRFAAGLFSTVRLQPTGEQTVTMVPVEALTEATDKTGYVYTVNADGKTIVKNKVTIAFLENNKAAIVSGLDNAHEVITEGVGYLTERSFVKVIR
ncbi:MULTISPECIES: efflux RND transporter periplasmic adaptor subunit [Niastella]|uniref:Efflux RND transporter periplasmic adaptor subunit n=1 Tax=Niastella soli TaxID=2821487 RepID=A0ABS3YM58_9BACT|nr:efflux RND transporter periplasmic adaptor subunit [Niastella soli]MBO9198974.1 efflux RND transporter periplasmic adaptor subunit [Niastella soli]